MKRFICDLNAGCMIESNSFLMLINILDLEIVPNQVECWKL